LHRFDTLRRLFYDAKRAEKYLETRDFPAPRAQKSSMLSIPHIAILFVVVLVVFGPEKLPELARNFGKIMGEFRKATGELRNTFEGHMRDLEREADLRNARERAANSAVMTPLPQSSDPSANPQPPAPASADAPRDPSFVPADGIVSARAPYANVPGVPGSTRSASAPAPDDAQSTLFDQNQHADNAPAGDPDNNPLPESVSDGRPGPA
jgi:sec-independent protein translocase protein TatB